MGPRMQVLTIALLIVVGLVAPAAAATETSQVPTLQAVVQEAHKMLQPFARQRNLTITVDATGSNPVSQAEAERLRERIINLLANGIALSPENNQVEVRLSPGQELSVWIGNDQVAMTVERDIRDQAGNFFKIRSKAGQGTELSTRFVSTAIGSLTD